MHYQLGNTEVRSYPNLPARYRYRLLVGTSSYQNLRRYRRIHQTKPSSTLPLPLGRTAPRPEQLHYPRHRRLEELPQGRCQRDGHDDTSDQT